MYMSSAKGLMHMAAISFPVKKTGLKKTFTLLLPKGRRNSVTW